MTWTDTINTTIGTTLTINDGVNPNTAQGANNDAQLAAMALSYKALISSNPLLIGSAISAEFGAIATQSAVLANDIQANNYVGVAADGLAILSNMSAGVGISLSYLNKPVGALWLTASNITGATSLAIQNAPAIIVAGQELYTEVQESLAGDQTLVTPVASLLAGATSTITNTWNTEYAAYSVLMNAEQNLINAIASGNSASISSAETAVSNDVNNAENPLNSFIGATGITASNVTDNVSGSVSANQFSLLGGNNSFNIGGTDNFGTNNGSATGFSLSADSYSPAVSDNVSVSSSAITDTLQPLNSNGTTQYSQTTTTEATGQLLATITGTGAVAALNNASISLSSGTSATIDGNNDTITGNGGLYRYNLNGVGDNVSVSDAFKNAFESEVTGGLDQIKFNGGGIVAVGQGSQDTIVSSDGTMLASNQYNGSSTVDDLINWNTPGTVVTGSSSRDWSLSNQQSGISATVNDYAGANGTGALLDTGFYGSNGGFQLDSYNAGFPRLDLDFNTQNANGNWNLSSVNELLSNGNTETINYNQNNPNPSNNPWGWTNIADIFNLNDQIIQSTQTYNNNYSAVTLYDPWSGQPLTTNDYTSSGQNWGWTTPGNTDISLADFTNSGMLTNLSVGLAANGTVSQTSDANLNIARDAGLMQAYDVANMGSNTHQSVHAGGKWGSNTITWSLATSPGTTGSPFSSYMSSTYLSTVQQAFAAWAANSGLTFQQVSDTTSTDIRIGWGTFNSAPSGIIGFTDYVLNSPNNTLNPNAIVRLEDPSQNALANNANGQLSYSGSNATLLQVLEHELGHALGLADNSDPNSVEYYQTTTSNPVIDATDSSGIQSLYSSLVTTTSFGTSGGQTLTGAAGYQIYNYAKGDGADSIVNGVSTNSGTTGELDFAAGIPVSGLAFSQSGNDLVIGVVGTTNDQVTVRNWFANTYSQLTTIQAGDGTRIANAGNGELMVENYAAGTSQAVFLTGIPSGVSSQTRNFSGLNGTGTVTGTTNNYDMNNSTFTSAAGTSSGVFGNNNTITEVAGSTALVGGNTNTINASGNDSLSIINSSSGTVSNVNGSNSTTTDAGTSDSVHVDQAGGTGSGNFTTMNGNSGTLTDYGTNNTDVENGTGDNIIAANNSDNLVSNNSGNNIGLLGNSDAGTLNGANDTGSAQGASDVFTATGTGATFDLRGSSDTGNLNGTNETGYADGANEGFNTTNNTVVVGGNLQGTTTISGNGNNITVGTNDTVIINANHDTVRVDQNISGSGNFTTINGIGSNTANAVTDYGTNDTVVDNSTGDNIIAANNNDNMVSNTSNNNISLLGNSDTGNLAGANDTASIQGTSDTITATGTGASFDLRGSYDTGNLNGANEIAYVNGANETVNATGTGDTIAVGTGLTVTINGSNLNIVAAAGDNITLNDTAGTNHITGSGAYTLTVNGHSYGNGNNYGTYGFAGNKSDIRAAINNHTDYLAQYDLSQGNTAGAAEADAAFQPLRTILSLDSNATVLEGAKWNSNVITWDIGNSALGSAAYQRDIQAAFDAWSTATGLTFEEVSGSTPADIHLNFADLDTKDSAVVGFTSYKATNGQMQAASIALENPTLNALVKGEHGQLTYSGTNATLTQVLEHEIGHALGLGDNNNPNSIMDYYLGSQNRTLSTQDSTAAQSLYGTTVSPTTETSLHQLIQAMASFGADTGAALSTNTPLEPFMLNGTIANNATIQHQ